MGQGVHQESLVFLAWMVSMGRRDFLDLKELKENLCMVLPFQDFLGIVGEMENVACPEDMELLGLKGSLAFLDLLDLRGLKDLQA